MKEETYLFDFDFIKLQDIRDILCGKNSIRGYNGEIHGSLQQSMAITLWVLAESFLLAEKFNFININNQVNQQLNF